MKKLVWTATARTDLGNIHDYVSQDSSFYADVLCLEIIQAAEKLLAFPKIGRFVPEYDDKYTREVIVNDYRVVYEIMEGRIYILTVVHGAKLLKKGI